MGVWHVSGIWGTLKETDSILKIFTDVCDLDLRTKCSCDRGQISERQWLWQRALMAHWLWGEYLWGRKSLGDPQLQDCWSGTWLLRRMGCNCTAMHTSATAATTWTRQRSLQSKLHKYMNAIIATTLFQEILMAFHILLVSPVTSELLSPFSSLLEQPVQAVSGQKVRQGMTALDP